jgi:WD40 repeat protein
LTPSRTLDGPAVFVGPIAYSADGRLLAWALGGDSGGQVVIWDVAADRPKFNLGAARNGGAPAPTVGCLAFAPDGRSLAVGTGAGLEGEVVLWDLATRARTATLRGHAGAVFAIGFNRDGTALVSAGRDKTARLWDRSSQAQRAILRVGTVPIVAAAMSPDGRTFATGWGDGAIRWWDTVAGNFRTTRHAPRVGVVSLAYSPTGRTLASSGQDKAIRLWDTERADERWSVGGLETPARFMSFSADGALLAVKFAETRRGAIYDAASGTRSASVSDIPSALAFSPSSPILAASGGEGGKVFFYDLRGLPGMAQGGATSRPAPKFRDGRPTDSRPQ